MFDFLKGKKDPEFPPRPKWKPAIHQPIEQIIDRFKYYTDGKNDFAVFKNGTCVILPDGLSETEAISTAQETISKIFHYHPDMSPQNMDDGNILIQYNEPAFNIVLNDFVKEHWAEIDKNHQNALATSEVLITFLGNNVFDDFGKKALFGRCFMFMDAQNPTVVNIVRKTA